jgi:hypothetical protein
MFLGSLLINHGGLLKYLESVHPVLSQKGGFHLETPSFSNQPLRVNQPTDLN